MTRSTLVYEYYQSPNSERQIDITNCFNHNTTINFESILVYGDLPLPSYAPLNAMHCGRMQRLEYRDFLSVVHQHRHLDGIAILTNSDILLDPTIVLKCAGIRPKTLYSISRYELDGRITPNAFCSQDTWVLRFQYIEQSLFQSCSFHLGNPGCELRFAELLYSKGYSVFNPALSVKNIHNQKNVSKYDESLRHHGAYIFAEPCSLDQLGSDPDGSCGRLTYLRAPM